MLVSFFCIPIYNYYTCSYCYILFKVCYTGQYNLQVNGEIKIMAVKKRKSTMQKIIQFFVVFMLILMVVSSLITVFMAIQ